MKANEVKKAKIKVALMSYAMDNRPGKGTSLYTRRLIENILEDERFEFYLVHYDKVDDPLYLKAKEILMPKIKLPFASHFVSQMIFFWKFRKNKFDIMHWFQPRVYPFYWLAPARKIVVTAHGAADITTNTFFVFSREVFNFVLSRMNWRVDAMFAVSQFGAQEIVQYYHMPPEKVYSVYNGGGDEYRVLDQKKSRHFIGKKYDIHHPYILCISRLEPHKNVDNLIRAYALFRDEVDRDVDLVIVGNPSHGHEKTYGLARQSRYSKNIIFVRFFPQEDLNRLYSGAEMFVFPSLNEGFGLPLVEAMASGVPIVSSNRAALPEVAGDAAVFADASDPKKLSVAMVKVFRDDNLKKTMIKRGICRQAMFQWKETARGTIDVYLKILET